jgi:hypothetical protein
MDDSEAERLREENAALRARLEGGRRGRLRAAAHWVLLTLAALLTVLAAIGIWADNQVTDTDRYVRTVAPLADDPSIQTLIVDRVTAAIADPERTEDAASELLPPRAAPLARPIAAALERFVHERVDRFVRSPDFADLWTGISRRTHASAVRLLTGEDTGGRLQVAGDLLVVDLGPLIGPVETVLERSGLDRSLLRGGDVEPEIVLGDASGIESARGAVRLLDRLAIVLPLLALLAFAGAVALAPTFRRGLLRAGLAIAVAMVVLAALLGIGRSIYLDAAESAVPREPAQAAFDILVAYLRDGMRVVLAVGLVVAVGAWLAGPGRVPTSLRNLVRGAGARAQSAGAGTGAPGRALAGHLRLAEGAIVAVAALVLVSQDAPSAGDVLRIGVVALVLVGLLELVAAAAQRSDPAP